MENKFWLELADYVASSPLTGMQALHPVLPLLWAFAPVWGAYLLFFRSPTVKAAYQRWAAAPAKPVLTYRRRTARWRRAR